MQTAVLGRLDTINTDRMKILLVDDHPENLLALESVLQDLGTNLVMAQSGRDALKELLHEDFAVILMDVQMPEMDGFETAMLIRERDRSRHTPILFLTAFNKSDFHVSTGYSIGAVDYVFKPFQPEILRAKVSALVDLSRKTRELEEEVIRRKAAEEEIRRLNDQLEQRVKQRTAELEATNRKLKKEITERKQAENEIIRHQTYIEALNQRLQRAMTETHHRVKNNLQIIAAMIEMHVLDDMEFIRLEELKKLSIHVQTLAAIHELLTQEAKEDGEAHYLPARQVLIRLIQMLERTVVSRHIAYDIAEVRFPARQGTSLALIVNELISNAIKYGNFAIEVSLAVENKNAILQVCDDGPGFPGDFDPLTASNTGLELVYNLSQWDLGGEVKFFNREQGGGCVRMTIPLVD